MLVVEQGRAVIDMLPPTTSCPRPVTSVQQWGVRKLASRGILLWLAQKWEIEEWTLQRMVVVKTPLRQ